MKLIPLTQGKFAMVDDDDFDFLNQWKWNAGLKKSTNTYYASRNQRTVKKNARQETIRMHRVIMNAGKGQIVDHRDGNTLNNQKNNLRFCTNGQNSANRRARENKLSRFLGVHYQKDNKNWLAQIRVNKKTTHLGCFKNEIDAAIAYNNAAILYHGEFARLNII